MLHHFILTRFNLPLWTEDKNGSHIDRAKWLEERLDLFETYCLPSIKNQSCLDFTWILLCDENTPVGYRDRIKVYKEQCPQIELIQVEEGYAWEFPRIFSDVVTSILEERGAKDGDLCLTTYLDNDDSLHKDYVEQLHQICSDIVCDSFVSFDYGLQYFTELNMATRVIYPNNHFMTFVERVHESASALAPASDLKPLNSEALKPLLPVSTCYGFGSHFLLEKYGIPVRHISDKDNPMWVEVVHKDNVDNDVKMTLDTEIINDADVLRNVYSLNIILSNARCAYGLRVLAQMFRRLKGKIKPRKWK